MFSAAIARMATGNVVSGLFSAVTAAAGELLGRHSSAPPNTHSNASAADEKDFEKNKESLSQWMNQYLQSVTWVENFIQESESNASSRPYLDSLISSLQIDPKEKQSMLGAVRTAIRTGTFCTNSGGVADTG